MADAPELLPVWAKLLAMGVSGGFAAGLAWAVLRSSTKGRATAIASMTENFHHLEERVTGAIKSFEASLSPVIGKVDRIHVELVGYTGADGLLADMKMFRQDLAALKDELATVDERITLSRHQNRTETTAIVGKAEGELLRIINDLDRRIAALESPSRRERGIA